MKYLSGFNVQFISKCESIEHKHTDLELLFVLDGECSVEIEGETEFLKREDIILINFNERHAVRCMNGALVCMMTISYEYFCDLTEEIVLFKCNSIIDNGTQYTELREKMYDLLFAYILKSEF